MWRWIILVVLVVGGVSCSKREEGGGQSAGEVVLYSSVDEPYLRPILARYEKEMGVKVRLVTDGEASKTVGLAARIEAERDRPRADVYWGNEAFHTIRLAEAGVLAAYRPKAAEDVPGRWRDAGDRWVGVGLRARVVVVPSDGRVGVRGVADLGRAEFKGKVGMAHPGFGTTSGHMAALYATLGEERFVELVKTWKANGIKLLGGNGRVVEQVAAGNLVAGLTDNDDVANAKGEGAKVEAVVPDQEGAGTLLVPTTIALVKGAPHGDQGRRLIEYLVRAETERELLELKFLAYSVRGEAGVKGMGVDYSDLARVMSRAVGKTLEILEGRGGAGVAP